MDDDVWNQMPDEYKQLNGCHFLDQSKAQYLIRSVEADNSRLEWIAGSGTCLNPSLPREYEVRVYEVEPISGKPGFFSYFGLSGQFTDVKQLANSYGVTLDKILASREKSLH